MNKSVTRRNFLIIAAGFVGGVVAWPWIAKANSLISRVEPPQLALESWLLGTGKSEYEPTVSFLLNGNTRVYLPFISK